MPSALIHLTVGRLTAEAVYDKTPDIAYFVGNVSPDCVSSPRELKDHLHLRDLDHDARAAALAELAGKYSANDVYLFGTLLHLWADLCWDEGPQHEHFLSYKGECWFKDYRAEISYASSYIYHSSDWGKTLWRSMLEAPLAEKCGALPEYTPNDIYGYLERNGRWHDENPTPPSEFFTPELVAGFCKDCSDRFLDFYKKYGKDNINNA